MVVLVTLQKIFQHSFLALRIGSTFITIGSVVALPIFLSQVSLETILLLAAACGYFLGFTTRVFMTCGWHRNALCLLPMQAYDYLCGGLLLGLCCLLSSFSFCRTLQTKSLLSAVFERRIAHNEVMKLLDTGA